MDTCNTMYAPSALVPSPPRSRLSGRGYGRRFLCTSSYRDGWTLNRWHCAYIFTRTLSNQRTSIYGYEYRPAGPCPQTPQWFQVSYTRIALLQELGIAVCNRSQRTSGYATRLSSPMILFMCSNLRCMFSPLRIKHKTQLTGKWFGASVASTANRRTFSNVNSSFARTAVNVVPK